MAKEGSVAPKERVNIVYKPATGDGVEEKELPLKVAMLGDYTMAEDERPVEDRKPIDVNKDNFSSVMKGQNLSLDINVTDTLSDEDDAQMSVSMKFENINDFTPEAIADQVPELQALLELREALQALKGPLGNMPQFRKKIEALLADESARDKILAELGVVDEK